VASVVPELTVNYRIPTLIFMLNNPTGSSDLAQALGRDRVLLGFPGAGGTRDGHLVRYVMIAQQPTTLGELDGQRTARLRNLVETFRQCGFPTTTFRDVDGWLKAHAFFVSPGKQTFPCRADKLGVACCVDQLVGGAVVRQNPLSCLRY
jgi:2-dehydropantoate 2-reductase